MTAPRVLVTGASGFIGRWALPALRRRNYEVHAVLGKTQPRAVRAEPPFEGCELHQLDLFDPAVASKLIIDVQPSHLLHFAWNATPGVYWTTEENFLWRDASLHLLQAFHANGGQRFVGAGSCAEYDWTVAGHCHEFDTPLVLADDDSAPPYAVCKASLQRAAASFAAQSDLSFGWGRIFNLFGPFEHPARLVPSVITSLLRGESASCSSGEQLRNFLYVADVADAFAAFLDSEVTGPVNIGSSEQTTVAALVRRIGDMIGRPELIDLGARPADPGEPAVLVPMVDRLTQEVGWQASQDLDSGLQKSIDWWREELAVSDS